MKHFSQIFRAFKRIFAKKNSLEKISFKAVFMCIELKIYSTVTDLARLRG